MIIDRVAMSSLIVTPVDTEFDLAQHLVFKNNEKKKKKKYGGWWAENIQTVVISQIFSLKADIA